MHRTLRPPNEPPASRGAPRKCRSVHRRLPKPVFIVIGPSCSSRRIVRVRDWPGIIGERNVTVVGISDVPCSGCRSFRQKAVEWVAPAAQSAAWAMRAAAMLPDRSAESQPVSAESMPFNANVAIIQRLLPVWILPVDSKIAVFKHRSPPSVDLDNSAGPNGRRSLNERTQPPARAGWRARALFEARPFIPIGTTVLCVDTAASQNVPGIASARCVTLQTNSQFGFSDRASRQQLKPESP